MLTGTILALGVWVEMERKRLSKSDSAIKLDMLIEAQQNVATVKREVKNTVCVIPCDFSIANCYSGYTG